VLFVSVLVLALRFALMAASLAPHLEGAPPWKRAALAFCITDENYALAVSRRGGALEPGYLLGSWLALYLSWVPGTAAGPFFGAQVPPQLADVLASIFPIVFVALIALTCATRAAAGVAVLGAVLGVLGALILPGGWHVVAGGLVASLVGPPLERLLGRDRGAA
jgi:predicted branched-subunit amino acid permease